MTPATTHHEPAGRRLTRSALLRKGGDRWCRSRHRRERRAIVRRTSATRAARSGARSRSSSGGTSCPRTTPGWTSGRVAGVSRTTSRLRSTASYTRLPSLAAAEAKAGKGMTSSASCRRLPLTRTTCSIMPTSSPRSSARSARMASSVSGARTTRKRRRTSASRTATCRARRSGDATSGNRSASRRQPGIT